MKLGAKVEHTENATIHEWTSTLQTLGTWGLVALSGLAFFWRRISRLFRGLLAAAGLVDRWGPSPADAIHSMLDIVKRSQSEAAIRFGIIDGVLGLGIYFCDSTGKCIAVNDVLCELFGRDSTDMVGKGWLAGISEKDRARVNEEWMSSVRTGIPYSATYIVCNNRTDELISCRSEAYAINDPDGNVTGFVGLVTPMIDMKNPPDWFVRLHKGLSS